MPSFRAVKGAAAPSFRLFRWCKGSPAGDPPGNFTVPPSRQFSASEARWAKRRAAVQNEQLDENTLWYVDGAGIVDLHKLLTAFATFYGENAEHWLRRFDDYREAAPQLILQAYLQRIVNGGGRIEREYGLGRGRTDLIVLWPQETGQPYDLWRRFVIECKVLRDSDRRSMEATVERGVEQTLGYMETCSAEEGHLVVFDRRGASDDELAGEARAGPRSPMNHELDGRRVAVWTL